MRPHRAAPALLLGLALGVHAASARAQHAAFDVRWNTGEQNPATAIVAADLDDDDDDGVPDALQRPAPPAVDDEVTDVDVAVAGPLHVVTTGALRVLGPQGLAREATLAQPQHAGRFTVRLVGVTPSATTRDASVVFEAGGHSVRVEVTVVAVALLHGDDAIVWPHRDAVGLSHEVTNDATLPREARWWDRSPDVDNVRAEVFDPGASHAGSVRIESVATRASVGMAAGSIRGAISAIGLDRPDLAMPLRGRFVRLVGDAMDLRAPGLQGQTLLVGLRDRIHLRYRRADAAGEATTDVRLGRPGNEDGPLAARRARWHLVVMRSEPGGAPVIGGDDASAIRIAREQVAVSNEIYLQCAMTFGEPDDYVVTLADPPRGTLLAVADDDGLRAAGGEVRFRAAGRAIGPVRVGVGWRAIDTAEAIGTALRTAGFDPRVTQNRRTDYGADGSADVTARDAHGHPVELAPWPAARLTTDPRQSIAIGRVDFEDGLDEFNNLNSSSGTLEERTLLKSLMDDDPSTVDLIVINRFTHETRIGEAFVEGDAGALLNALVLDRTGIAAEREAWTQSHEAGHVFLNQPWHPDNMGPDRPWLLMDADASLGRVDGPKRLTREECARIDVESGPRATPSLLARYDAATPSADAVRYLAWPEHDPYPRSSVDPGSRVAPTAPTVRAYAADRPARAYGVQIR